MRPGKGSANSLGSRILRGWFSGLNATEGINQGLKGVLRAGDHVITSSMEHNSVMRPLRAMVEEGLELTVVPCSPEGFLDPQDVKKAVQAEHPDGGPSIMLRTW